MSNLSQHEMTEIINAIVLAIGTSEQELLQNSHDEKAMRALIEAHRRAVAYTRAVKLTRP